MIPIDDMATFCKEKGFVYPNSEIYGGLAGFFDYGPLGVELKNNLKQNWWKHFVKDRQDILGIDGSILSHPKVWQASGHVDSFTDMLVECKKCRQRFRADNLIENKLNIQAEGLSEEDTHKIIQENNLKCPNCNSDLSKPSQFNLMFKTFVGPKESKESITYLRPETAQLIFTSFKLITDTQRVKLPFGIAQIGKAFRNEISPREFLFRVREFEQLEIEFFIHPQQKDCPLLTKEDLKFEFQISTAKQKKHKKIKAQEIIKKKIASPWHTYWLIKSYQWYLNLGLKKENLRLREHSQDELAHYSKACFDIEYNFPFGWREIQGCADRQQYDLKQHQKVSQEKLSIYHEETKEKVIPSVIEPSFGLGRTFLALLYDAYKDDQNRGNIVLHFKPDLAPTTVAIFPLVRNKEKVTKKAQEVYQLLKKCYPTKYDESGSIGKRYARSDEQGIPFCITIDFDTLKDQSVTIRDRDSTDQIRVKIDQLNNTLFQLIMGAPFKDVKT